MEISILQVINIYKNNNIIPFAIIANEYGIVLQFDNNNQISNIYNLVYQFNKYAKSNEIGYCDVAVEFGENFTEIYLSFK